ncbi:MAG: glycosyltransferase [Christensenellaceae bacterium]|jgi:glycosyltransferase involved in cell wall biosynthesis|nr:glycosyltransferase [Christensenellaceae bacterium]
MKLLINLCAHDGIISYYAGVGTIVKGYVKLFYKYCNSLNCEYKINLFTPEYNTNSFGYSKTIHIEHLNLKNVEIFLISNGTNGQTGFGNVPEWQNLVNNTAKVINKIDISCFDKVITVCNDGPFAKLPEIIKPAVNHKKIWIPHSSHAASPGSLKLKWEQEAIDFINNDNLSFLGANSEFMGRHMLDEFSIKKHKILPITCGEVLDSKEPVIYGKPFAELFKQIENYDAMVFAFGRAEEYKNLEAALLLKKELNLPSVVIARSYSTDQPILNTYRQLAAKTEATLFIDPPDNFSKYILQNFKKKVIMLIPSKREPFGLIINEIRRLNRNNILIVANDIGGLSEQIDDTKDGVLVNLDNLQESALKILKYFNDKDMHRMNLQAQITLKKDMI